MPRRHFAASHAYAALPVAQMLLPSYAAAAAVTLFCRLRAARRFLSNAAHTMSLAFYARYGRRRILLPMLLTPRCRQRRCRHFRRHIFFDAAAATLPHAIIIFAYADAADAADAGFSMPAAMMLTPLMHDAAIDAFTRYAAAADIFACFRDAIAGCTRRCAATPLTRRHVAYMTMLLPPP